MGTYKKHGYGSQLFVVQRECSGISVVKQTAQRVLVQHICGPSIMIQLSAQVSTIYPEAPM